MNNKIVRVYSKKQIWKDKVYKVQKLVISKEQISQILFQMMASLLLLEKQNLTKIMNKISNKFQILKLKSNLKNNKSKNRKTKIQRKRRRKMKKNKKRKAVKKELTIQTIQILLLKIINNLCQDNKKGQKSKRAKSHKKFSKINQVLIRTLQLHLNFKILTFMSMQRASKVRLLKEIT